MTEISIIIPHYNSEKKLMRLLKTIPESDKIEIIVVDDNSEKELNLKNKNIIVKRNLSNKRSAGTCRNIGLSIASGRWIIFADSDDFFLPNAFKIIKNHLNSKEDIIYFTPTSIIEGTKNESFRHLGYKKLIDNYMNLALREEIRYLFYVPWSKMIKSTLIREHNIKFDEVLASNDVKFSVLIGHFAKEISCSKEKIYCVTENKSSLTKKKDKEHLNSRIKVALNTNLFLKKNKKRKYCLKYKGYILRNLKNGIRNGIGNIMTVIKYKFIKF